MAYEKCKTLRDVRAVLRNYDGILYPDCGTLGGYWIDVDCQEFWGWNRADIIRQANELFKKRGWARGMFGENPYLY